MILSKNGGTTNRVEANAIYAAFFMEGLRDNDYDDVLTEAGKHCLGAIEMVTNLVSYTSFVDQMITAAQSVMPDGFSFPGVFPYEVCSSFGQWYGKQMIVAKMVPGENSCKDWLRQETLQFFGRADDKATLGRIQNAIQAIWPFGVGDKRVQ